MFVIPIEANTIYFDQVRFQKGHPAVTLEFWLLKMQMERHWCTLTWEGFQRILVSCFFVIRIVEFYILVKADKEILCMARCVSLAHL